MKVDLLMNIKSQNHIQFTSFDINIEIYCQLYICFTSSSCPKQQKGLLIIWDQFEPVF